MTERYVATGAFTGRFPKSTVPNVEERLKTLPGAGVVHLHWLWKRGPAALRGITSAVALCGATQINRQFVTSHLDDATCPKCKRLAS